MPYFPNPYLPSTPQGVPAVDKVQAILLLEAPHHSPEGGLGPTAEGCGKLVVGGDGGQPLQQRRRRPGQPLSYLNGL
jgi:hypothetical protein